jgi:hemerythrin-like domain-containing protein
MATTTSRPDLLHPAPAPSFDDPLGMLLACHVRMRRQLATLARLQRHLPANGVDAEARAAANAIIRYFDRAAPDHHADEDRSVLPRLAARAPALAPLVESIGREHLELMRRWRKMRPLLSSIAAGTNQALPPRLVREVCEGYAIHLEREETQVFPHAREHLDAAAIEAIGREFAARREQRDAVAAMA